jgi:hypothetical protein
MAAITIEGTIMTWGGGNYGYSAITKPNQTKPNQTKPNQKLY